MAIPNKARSGRRRAVGDRGGAEPVEPGCAGPGIGQAPAQAPAAAKPSTERPRSRFSRRNRKRPPRRRRTRRRLACPRSRASVAEARGQRRSACRRRAQTCQRQARRVACARRAEACRRRDAAQARRTREGVAAARRDAGRAGRGRQRARQRRPRHGRSGSASVAGAHQPDAGHHRPGARRSVDRALARLYVLGRARLERRRVFPRPPRNSPDAAGSRRSRRIFHRHRPAGAPRPSRCAPPPAR